MKRSKFTDAQIAFVMQQAEDGTPVAEVCRKAGIAEATFYNWPKKYGGLMPSEMKVHFFSPPPNTSTPISKSNAKQQLHQCSGERHAIVTATRRYEKFRWQTD